MSDEKTVVLTKEEIELIKKRSQEESDASTEDSGEQEDNNSKD